MPLPEEIKRNPEVDMPVDGIRGWKVGSDTGLVVFFEIEPGTFLPEHSHCYQWGFVIEGEIELNIGCQSRIFREGESYVIPAGVRHSGRIEGGCCVMDYFADPKRY